MNPPDHQPPPGDPEFLLRSGLRDTTPEFERRWTDLKRELRTRPTPGVTTYWRCWWAAAVPAAAALGLILVLLPRPQPGPTPTELAAYEGLFFLEDELRSALPLSEDATLDDLLAMPAPSLDPS